MIRDADDKCNTPGYGWVKQEWKKAVDEATQDLPYMSMSDVVIKQAIRDYRNFNNELG